MCTVITRKWDSTALLLRYDCDVIVTHRCDAGTTVNLGTKRFKPLLPVSYLYRLYREIIE